MDSQLDPLSPELVADAWCVARVSRERDPDELDKAELRVAKARARARSAFEAGAADALQVVIGALRQTTPQIAALSLLVRGRRGEILRAIGRGVARSQTALAATLRLAEPHVSRYVRELSRANLIERAESAGRGKFWRLTEQGRGALDALVPVDEAPEEFETNQAVAYEVRIRSRYFGGGEIVSPTEIAPKLTSVGSSEFGIVGRIPDVFLKAFESGPTGAAKTGDPTLDTPPTGGKHRS